MAETLEQVLSEMLTAGGEVPVPVPASPRERIVHAALELFAEHSYEAATTKAIARRANVTERTLFKHFSSKEQLFARTVFPALLRTIAPLTVAPIAQLMDTYAGDFEALIRALVTERVAFARQHPEILAMAVREILLRPPFRTAIITFFHQQMQPQIEEVIHRAQATGQIRDLPIPVVMRAILGQVMAYIVTRVLLAPDAPWDDAAEVEHIVTLIMRGIGQARKDD